MISRPSDRESSRRRRFGLGGSLVTHVVALAVFVTLVPFFVRPEPHERTSTRELVTITRRPHRPTPAPVAVRPPPTPEPTATPTPPPVVAKPSHVAPVPQVVPKTAPIPVPVRAPKARPRPTVPHLARAPVRPIARAPRARSVPRLSQTSIDRIEGDLAKSIGRDRAKIDPLHVAYATPAPPKNYGPAASTFQVGDSRHGGGLCDPIKSWTDVGYDYYFVSCNVHLSDGTFERQDVPWPVRFAPSDDPFNGTAHSDRPLSMPLPGWTLAAGETISPQLREYAAAHGVGL